ncbi:MAG: hypothetical protein DRQ78_09575 [Epsilonproteobacteria bacterium]|nr:MAG: hypothetical protein DRQ78_09575 [Campylobacterota bacterium]
MSETIDTPTVETDQMGYEGQLAKETTLPETSNAKDVQTIINEAVKEVTVDEGGKYVYPKDMDPMLKAAVAATKSYRDNQSGFTKSQQSLKESEAEATALREELANVTEGRLELSKEDLNELNELKTSDPEAWRVKLNSLEEASKTAINEKLDEVTEKVRNKASGEHELARRYAYLKEFNIGREFEITPDTLDDDIPPRITAKLADGTYTFEKYLDEVATYLDKGKVVASVKPNATKDLNGANGSSNPATAENDKQGELDYSQQAF